MSELSMYKDLINKGELFLVNDSLLTKDQHAEYQSAKEQATYFDMLQGVRKVLLKMLRPLVVIPVE